MQAGISIGVSCLDWATSPALPLVMGSLFDRCCSSLCSWIVSSSVSVLAKIRAVANAMCIVGGPTTELFAQDPRFTAADKAVLKAYGVRVLDLPKAEQIIDEQTFVMSPGLIIPDLFFAQTTALPGLLVGHGGEQTRRDPETHVQEVLK